MGLLIQAPTELLPVADSADVGAARRAVRSIAQGLSAREADVGAAELVATELATNVDVHAGNGYLLVRAIPERSSLELIAVDRGPGLSAGNGSPHGLGVGLASVERLASTFDVFTQRTEGTVALARFEFGDQRHASALQVGGISLPVVPLDANGDGWAVDFDERGCRVVVVDGLGHGPSAHAAAQAALETLARDGDHDIAGSLVRAHEAMRSTRGGVAGVARIDVLQGTVQFVGVGNVSGTTVVSGQRKGLASRPGLLGTEHNVPKPHVVEAPWSPGSALIMWSDGLRSGLRLDEPPDLLGHDPAVVAAALHRDFARGNDDATVVVVRDATGERP